MLTQDELKSILSYDKETGQFKWLINASTKARIGYEAGTIDRDGYTIIRYRGRGYKSHRLAWLYVYGVWPEKLLDHKNQLKNDNSIGNLREATPSENNLNITQPNKGTASGLRGVSWFEQYRKWSATFQIRGKKFFIGYFDDKHEAYKAVQIARQSQLFPTKTCCIKNTQSNQHVTSVKMDCLTHGSGCRSGAPQTPFITKSTT